MISATGEHSVDCPARLSRCRVRSSGFTMVEVMVVVAILTLLASIIATVALGQRKKASIAASRALLQRIELALGEYRTLKGGFPRDGIDSEVSNADGTSVRGSAALYHFLSSEIEVIENRAGEERQRMNPPMMEFKSTEIEEDPENPGVFEIVDAFGIPIHYDNTENDRFEPQDGSVHMPEVTMHPPDPRESVEYGSVTREGIQRVGFDLWSHGEVMHRIEFVEEKMKLTIGTWNLGEL